MEDRYFRLLLDYCKLLINENETGNEDFYFDQIRDDYYSRFFNEASLIDFVNLACEFYKKHPNIKNRNLLNNIAHFLTDYLLERSINNDDTI